MLYLNKLNGPQLRSARAKDQHFQPIHTHMLSVVVAVEINSSCVFLFCLFFRF